MKRACFTHACMALIGTPFHHQGRTRTAVDCIGLIILASMNCGVTLAQRIPPYSRLPDPKVLTENLSMVAEQISMGDESPGDLIVFAWNPKRLPQHFGVLLPMARFIHTNAKVNRVSVEPLSGVWAGRLHSFWRLKEVED